MNKQQSLPSFGNLVPGEGGVLGAIMRGNVVAGVRQPDYAVIVPKIKAKALTWGVRGQLVSGADSLTDGLANTQAMLLANCPAAIHIASLTADRHADLYLPSRAEYWALRANVPELFEKAYHWTSTQYSSDGAFIQDFEDGYSTWDLKDNGCRVAPVRRIPLYPFAT